MSSPFYSTALDDQERAIYAWQMWLPGFGEAGQQRLKAATVLISRVGGLGGLVAYELAAAGVGRLILAHAGNIKPSDLNRQLLMTHQALGTSRIECAVQRLRELNPRVEILGVGENLSENNAERLVNEADVVVDCAPLFAERYAMNDAAIRLRKPLVECAMYGWEFQLFSVRAGVSACLRCLHPSPPPMWKREFPVLGAVSGSVACLGAVETLKILTGLGDPLYGRMLRADLSTMDFAELTLTRRDDCSVCGPRHRFAADDGSPPHHTIG